MTRWTIGGITVLWIWMDSYAFVEFEDDRDAKDAYNEMRDTRFQGYRLNVEVWKPVTCVF